MPNLPSSRKTELWSELDLPKTCRRSVVRSLWVIKKKMHGKLEQQQSTLFVAIFIYMYTHFYVIPEALWLS